MAYSFSPKEDPSEFAFSPDGARVLVEERGASRRSSLRVWDLTKTHELARVDISYVLLQIPGSDTVMTRMEGVMTGREGLWRTWSPGNTVVDPITPWRAHFLKRISPGGLLLTSHMDGSDTLLDVDTGKQLPFSPPHEKSTVSVAGIARNARFVALILGDSQAVAHVYDAETGSSVANLPHNTPISDLLFVDEDDSVVTTSVKTRGQFWANRLHLWRWRSGETKTLSADNPIRPVAASPDGSVFATGEGVKESDFESLDADFRSLKANISQARLWNARTGKELLRLPHSEPVYDVAFSPNGYRLVTRSPHEISVFRVRDGVKLNSFRMEHGGPQSEVMFASDGRRVVADVPEGVRIWSLDGKESRLLRHEKGWPPFALSGSGTHLATLDDKTIRVWDIAAGSELARATLPLAPYGHTSKEQFAFAGKRDDLIVSSGDRLVRVLWRTEDLIEEACRRLLPNLFEEDRRRFQELNNPADPQLYGDWACARSTNAMPSPYAQATATP